MIHSTALLVLLAVLATARLTRLVNADAILDRPRDWLTKRASDTVVYFISCPWCVSMWLGAGVAAAVYGWHEHAAVQIVLIALAASYVTGMLALVMSRLDDS